MRGIWTEVGASIQYKSSSDSGGEAQEIGLAVANSATSSSLWLIPPIALVERHIEGCAVEIYLIEHESTDTDSDVGDTARSESSRS